MEEFQVLVRRIFKIFLVIFTIITIVFIGLFTYEPNSNSIDKMVNIESGEWQPKDVLSELDNMPEQVLKVYFLITETPKYMGPMAEDERLRFTGNNLACTSCHLKGGIQAGSASWVGVTERFP
jgi:thiosulfate dehydrogenase